jgi:hypothetical protein
MCFTTKTYSLKEKNPAGAALKRTKDEIKCFYAQMANN